MKLLTQFTCLACGTIAIRRFQFRTKAKMEQYEREHGVIQEGYCSRECRPVQ